MNFHCSLSAMYFHYMTQSLLSAFRLFLFFVCPLSLVSGAAPLVAQTPTLMLVFKFLHKTEASCSISSGRTSVVSNLHSVIFPHSPWHHVASCVPLVREDRLNAAGERKHRMSSVLVVLLYAFPLGASPLRYPQSCTCPPPPSYNLRHRYRFHAVNNPSAGRENTPGSLAAPLTIHWCHPMGQTSLHGRVRQPVKWEIAII